MINIWYAAFIYLVIVNLSGLCLMGIDKNRARRHAWRISEKTFFVVGILGGSVGTWAGMYLFRHKTRHWYFVVGMPFLVILQTAVFLYLCK
ncbi:MAG: DUF1294 domain-containing protein [Lachnospiraceae bacterium]|nr:DUF1294 domain-containing protein [Lachnospiraceae bacterium]MDE6980666.1 DUF1294 domain-containing protein [Lachnospiraceae bacterium]